MEKYLGHVDCISTVMTQATNPLMLYVLTIDLLQKLAKQFRSLRLRILDIEDKINENMVAIYSKIFMPDQVEALLKQRDIDGVSVLEYMSELKLYKFLQINQINRIVSGMWHSKTDVGSSVFTLATSYDLVYRNKLRFKEDRERRKRFNEPRPLEDFSKPHVCSFSVWQRSLNLRYLIEAFMFLVLMIVF